MARSAAGGRRDVLIVGCGDIGRRVAVLEQAEGHDVAGSARSAQAEASLRELGIPPLRMDLDDPATLSSLDLRDQVLYYFAPPPASGEGDPRLSALLASINPPHYPMKLVYISTSGVYGDCQGAWIDETHPLNAKSERARRRVAAEELLQAWGRATGVPFVILRVPGIYGPGRLPAERLRAGTPVVCEAEAPYSNRIHADDLAAVCLAAARHGRSGQAYNVSDGHPTTMTDYFFRVADILGLKRPPTISLEEARRVLSPSMLSFLEESKRLDNRKMLAELQISLRYPDLQTGLPACL
ncbi:SDR family oxidoreductase [Methyloterricola oryzae]|uniref:SDR family oxidoreductase n=1 Tax=Methyloterricola oryzae TaxID=1495050 RepID=UPI0005EB43E6|nr:SDR family oxidoreductase [Methyloterricola oryzae]